MIIEPYTPSDAAALAAIYRDAVEQLAPGLYTPEQVAAWAAWADDVGRFGATLTAGYTLCAREDGVPVAFGQLHPADRIALLYTRASHSRQGYGGALYDALEAEARRQGSEGLRTEASFLSRPLFERKGFTILETESVALRGIPFERFRMEKRLR